MYKLLLVEDNEMIVKGLVFSLKQNDFLVNVAYSYKEAIDLIKPESYDLIILDITLPDGNGIDLGKYVKENASTPLMFLTAKDEEDDVVLGLSLGAEDYIIKPFRTKELIARIQNILKRSDNRRIKQVGNVLIDLEKCEVKVDHKIVNFTSLEYRILALLFTNLNKVVTREILLEKIWDIEGNYVNDNTLSVYIKRIREKLNNDLIKTIKGIGYRIDIK